MLTPARVLAAGLVLVGGVGCARVDERPWYKPGGSYTTAEFNRDREACTRDKKLDPDCMAARGWVQVSPDRPEPPAPTRAPAPRPPRY